MGISTAKQQLRKSAGGCPNALQSTAPDEDAADELHSGSGDTVPLGLPEEVVADYMHPSTTCEFEGLLAASMHPIANCENEQLDTGQEQQSPATQQIQVDAATLAEAPRSTTDIPNDLAVALQNNDQHVLPFPDDSTSCEPPKTAGERPDGESGAPVVNGNVESQSEVMLQASFALCPAQPQVTAAPNAAACQLSDHGNLPRRDGFAFGCALKGTGSDVAQSACAVADPALQDSCALEGAPTDRGRDVAPSACAVVDLAGEGTNKAEQAMIPATCNTESSKPMKADPAILPATCNPQFSKPLQAEAAIMPATCHAESSKPLEAAETETPAVVTMGHDDDPGLNGKHMDGQTIKESTAAALISNAAEVTSHQQPAADVADTPQEVMHNTDESGTITVKADGRLCNLASNDGLYPCPHKEQDKYSAADLVAPFPAVDRRASELEAILQSSDSKSDDPEENCGSADSPRVPQETNHAVGMFSTVTASLIAPACEPDAAGRLCTSSCSSGIAVKDATCLSQQDPDTMIHNAAHPSSMDPERQPPCSESLVTKTFPQEVVCLQQGADGCENTGVATGKSEGAAGHEAPVSVSPQPIVINNLVDCTANPEGPTVLAAGSATDDGCGLHDVPLNSSQEVARPQDAPALHGVRPSYTGQRPISVSDMTGIDVGEPRVQGHDAAGEVCL
jgi:hypothetical protein